MLLKNVKKKSYTAKVILTGFRFFRFFSLIDSFSVSDSDELLLELDEAESLSELEPLELDELDELEELDEAEFERARIGLGFFVFPFCELWNFSSG